LSTPIDVIVLADEACARKIYERLRASGICHVDFFPEHLLDPHAVFKRDARRIDEADPEDHLGPFHVRVQKGDLAWARSILSKAELPGDSHAAQQGGGRDTTRS
jgi:hypothetical protein